MDSRMARAVEGMSREYGTCGTVAQIAAMAQFHWDLSAPELWEEVGYVLDAPEEIPSGGMEGWETVAGWGMGRIERGDEER